jgi:TonB family protein
VVIEFSLEKDGTVTAMRLGGSSGDKQLERAAWAAVTMTAPFPPLPTGFSGSHVVLRFVFSYNEGPRVTLFPTAIQLHGGESQQFSVTSNAGENALSWSLTGPGCTEQLCGTVSPTDLYTAPSVVSEHRELTVSAKSVGDPSASATATITLEPTRNPSR